MRKLASVQKIRSIEPIEGADRIELARVLGWQCVVNKEQFKVEDLAVYFEIDSFLPMREEFEFLRKNCFAHSDLLGDGFRLRTRKFRGKISQGLLLPVSDFPQLGDVCEGDDVTEALGVRKWAVQERSTSDGTIIGGLPPSVPHTDETRIQAQPDLLSEFRGVPYYITTKMDGSSHSVSIDTDGLHVTSHNCEFSSGKFYDFVKEQHIDQRMRLFMQMEAINTLTLQGELCGPGIQQNRLKLDTPEWYVFTMIENGSRVPVARMIYACTFINVSMVPFEETGGDLCEKYPTIESLLERADGEYECGGKKEGIVVRPTMPVMSKVINDWLSFKVVNNSFLIKAGD